MATFDRTEVRRIMGSGPSCKQMVVVAVGGPHGVIVIMIVMIRESSCRRIHQLRSSELARDEQSMVRLLLQPQPCYKGLLYAGPFPGQSTGSQQECRKSWVASPSRKSLSRPAAHTQRPHTAPHECWMISCAAKAIQCSVSYTWVAAHAQLQHVAGPQKRPAC